MTKTKRKIRVATEEEARPVYKKLIKENKELLEKLAKL